MKNAKFMDQVLPITPKYKDQLISEAEHVLKSKDSTEKDKSRAKSTLDKIQNLETLLHSTMGRSRQSGSGDAKKKTSQDSFSSQFYDESLVSPEKLDEIYEGENVLIMDQVRVVAYYCNVQKTKYIFIRKTNTKYDPTILKIAVVEVPDFLEKCQKILKDIQDTAPTETIPILQGEYGSVDSNDANFFNSDNSISTKSGVLVLRPYKTEDASFRFQLLSPRKDNQYNWIGPSMTISFGQFVGLLKYMRHIIETENNNL